MLNLCRRSGVDYNRVKHNRSDCRIPKADDLLLLSRGVGRSIEFLLTGEDHQESALPPEARAVMEDDALRTLVMYNIRTHTHRRENMRKNIRAWIILAIAAAVLAASCSEAKPGLSISVRDEFIGTFTGTVGGTPATVRIEKGEIFINSEPVIAEINALGGEIVSRTERNDTPNEYSFSCIVQKNGIATSFAFSGTLSADGKTLTVVTPKIPSATLTKQTA